MGWIPISSGHHHLGYHCVMQRPIFMPCGTIAVIIITINSPTLKKKINREDSFIYPTTLSTVNTNCSLTFVHFWTNMEMSWIKLIINFKKFRQTVVRTHSFGEKWVQYVLSFYISYFFLYQMKYAALCCLKLCMFAVDMNRYCTVDFSNENAVSYERCESEPKQ